MKERIPEPIRPEDPLFYEAFRACPVGIALEDLEGWPIFVNPALCKMLGFSEGEMRGRKWIEFLPPEDSQKDSALFEQVRSGSIKQGQLDKRFTRRDGSTIWGRLSLSLLSRGSLVLVVAIVEDITEEKVAQETLELATERVAAVVRCSRDYRYVWANQGYADLVQRPLDKLIGRPMIEVLGQPAFDVLRPHFQRVLSGRRTSYEEEVDYRNAGPRWISVTHTPTFDDHSIVSGWVSSVVDITERKHFEESLVWQLDFESLVSNLSRTFIGLTEEEIDANMEQGLSRVAKFLKMDRITLFEFSPNRADLTPTYSWNAPGVDHPPATVSSTQTLWWIDRTRRGEESLASRVEDLPPEARVEREFLLERGVVSVASVPLRLGGEINGAISFVTVRRQVSWTDDLVKQLRVIGDIFCNALKRKRAHEALRAANAVLRESENRFRLVANSAPVMIWMSDPDRRCSYFNQPWLEFRGRPLDTELTGGWMDGVHPEDRQRCLDADALAFENRRPITIEYRLRRHDGEYRWVLDSGVPRFNPDGSFAGFIGSVIDVTDRKQAEEALSSVSQRLIEAQEQERSRLARELHDDINQRMALLAVSLERIKQNLRRSATPMGLQIEEAGKQVSDIATDVQALSHRLHSSKLELLGLAAAAKGFCQEFAELFHVKIEFHSKQVPRELPPQVSLALFRILQEALQNAAKHSGSRHYQVFLAGKANEVELTVHDSGRGFELEEAFRSRGLGLTSMKERIKLVDGDLSIDSRLRHGTTVHARVPFGAKTKSAQSAG